MQVTKSYKKNYTLVGETMTKLIQVLVVVSDVDSIDCGDHSAQNFYDNVQKKLSTAVQNAPGC